MLTAVPSMDTAKLKQTLQSKVDNNVAPNEIQKNHLCLSEWLKEVEGGVFGRTITIQSLRITAFP